MGFFSNYNKPIQSGKFDLSMPTFVMIFMAVALYLGATALILRPPQLNGPALVIPTRRRLYLAMGWLAVLFHGAGLVNILAQPGGIDLSFFSTAALVTLMIVLLFLLAAFNKPIDKLGAAVLPLASLALVLRLAFPNQVHLLTNLSGAMQLHILVSILAYSLLNIAALQAILLALQDWHLRHKQNHWLVRSLPALQTMEALLFQMIAVGFVLLTLSLASGFLFVEDLFAQHLVHKTVLSLLSWLLFGVLLWGRWRYGWRGQTAIRWTLGGFAALVLAFFGSKLVLEIILRRV